MGLQICSPARVQKLPIRNLNASLKSAQFTCRQYVIIACARTYAASDRQHPGRAKTRQCAGSRRTIYAFPISCCTGYSCGFEADPDYEPAALSAADSEEQLKVMEAWVPVSLRSPRGTNIT